MEFLNLTNNNVVKSFTEKPQGDNNWINGGYFILKKDHLDLIKGDNTSWEAEPLQQLTKKGKLAAYKHKGFWKAMDTLSDKRVLENFWFSKKAPWKIW